MGNVSTFDYARDPLPDWVVAITRLRFPRHAAPAGLAFVVSIGVLCGCIAIEQQRLWNAEEAQRATTASYLHVKEQLAASDLEVADANTLLALDRELRAVRASGYERARLLADIGAEMPSSAWLTDVAPAGGASQVSGQAEDVRAIERMLLRLNGGRFGNVVLEHVSRVERVHGPALFEFAIQLDRL